MALISVRDLHKDYLNDDVVTTALRNINFEIQPGEFVAIMGPSGSGKSTLMHILGFLDRPTSGVFEFEGQDIRDFNDDMLAGIRNNKVGFVFQSFNLLPRTTVLENVKLPLLYSNATNPDKQAKAALEAVGLGHRLEFFTNQISGGEKQRAAIARALVNDPAIIFADEPTGNLDSKSGGVVMHILQKLNDSGRTIILVTHEKDTAEHAKRLIKIKDGEIVADEPIRERRFANGFEQEKNKS